MSGSAAQLYSERMTPGVAAWLLAPATGLAGFLVVWPLHAALGMATGIGLTLGLVILLWATSPVIALESRDRGVSLRAGRAVIPVDLLGEPRVLSRQAMRAQMGPELQPAAYVCHRPWMHRGVHVTVTDPADPTPYWLLASHTPDRLAQALQQAQAAHSEHTG